MGEIFKIWAKGIEPYMKELDNHLENMLYYLYFISLSAIYTSPITERHKRPNIGLYNKLQNLLPINSTSFHRKSKFIIIPYIFQ